MFMQKRTITIFGRKTDMHLIIACILLTIFIVINTSYGCINTPCKKCDTDCNIKNESPSIEPPDLPPPSDVVGTDHNAFSDLASF